MNEWLLTLIFAFGNAGGVSTERIATHEECEALGEAWVDERDGGMLRSASFSCVEIEPLHSDRDRT